MKKIQIQENVALVKAILPGDGVPTHRIPIACGGKQRQIEIGETFSKRSTRKPNRDHPDFRALRGGFLFGKKMI
jgi:hypothetical protein